MRMTRKERLAVLSALLIAMLCSNGLAAQVSSTIPNLTTNPSPSASDWMVVHPVGAARAMKMSTGTLLEGRRPVVLAGDFGAVADDAIDDTTSIQNAINSLPVGGGDVLLEVCGDYRINDDLDIGDGSVSAESTRHGVRLLGCAWGGDATEMTVASTQGTRILWFGSAGGTMVSINGPIMGVAIENLGLVGKGATNVAGTIIYSMHAAQATFRNLHIARYSAIGIKVDAVGGSGLPSGVAIGGDDVTWDNVQVGFPESTSAVALDLGATTSGGTATDNARHLFLNCEFRGGTGVSGRGAIFRFIDNITFVTTHFVGGESNTSIEVIPPTGNLTFPKVITFLHGIITGNVLVPTVGSWNPGGDHGLTFLPLAVESGTVPSDPRIKGFNGSNWFGPLTINEEGYDADVRIEGDADASLFCTDAFTNKVGIGICAPTAKLHVAGTATNENTINIVAAAAQTSTIVRIGNNAGTALMRVDVSGNVLVGSLSAAGASATSTIAIQNGTPPTTSTIDSVQIFSADTAAGDANLYSRNETGIVEQLTGLTRRNSNAFTATSTTTLANITGLTFNVQAGKAYGLRAVLPTTSSVAGGVKFAVGGTATATSIWYEGELHSAGTTIQTRAAALATEVCAVTAVTAATCYIEGGIVVSAAGTLTITFAQNASNGSASTVLANSKFFLEPLGN